MAEQNINPPVLRDSPPVKGAKGSVSADVDEIVGLYHRVCVSLPKVIKVTEGRRRVIKARWKEYGELAAFGRLFEKAEASSFLKGDNGRGWRANFDWLINEANMVKVLEGNYDNKGKAPSGVSTFSGKKIDFETIERKAREMLLRPKGDGGDGG